MSRRQATGVGRGSAGKGGKGHTQPQGLSTGNKDEPEGGYQSGPTPQAPPQGKGDTATKKPSPPSSGASHDESAKMSQKKVPVECKTQSAQAPPTTTQPSNRPPYYHSSSVDGRAGSRSWHQQEPQRQRSHSFHLPWQSRHELRLPNRQPHCPPDIEEYQKGYPTVKDNKKWNANYEFYTGKIAFQPKGVLIDRIFEYWWGRYDILERRHDYIQWLFPTRDGSAMSYFAQPLQKHEILAICGDESATERVLKSYRMMLDFYGMKLMDTGEVTRKEGNWQERFAHLNRSIHNHMRITRILKSLGELDYEHLKAPFVRFILHTIFKDGYLVNTLESCMKYWVETIRDENERDSLWLLAGELAIQRQKKH